MSESNNLAQLAADLIAAKGLSDVWTSVWESVSPAKKQEIADQVATLVVKQLGDISWRSGHIAESALLEMAKGIAMERRADYGPKIVEQMERAIADGKVTYGLVNIITELTDQDYKRAIDILSDRRRALEERTKAGR